METGKSFLIIKGLWMSTSRAKETLEHLKPLKKVRKKRKIDKAWEI